MTPGDAQAAPGMVGGRPARLARAAGWVALVALMLSVVVAALAGERDVSFDELLGGISSGAVRSVELSGGLPVSAVGSAPVDITYRDGWRRRHTTVEEVRDGVHADADKGPWQQVGDQTTIHGDLAASLRLVRSDLEITRGTYSGSGALLFGRLLPPWWAALPLAGMPAWLVAVSSGVEPRGGTRWAWFWLSATTLMPLVIPAYVLWGARGLRPEDAGRRRLTGGWAFVLFLFFHGTSDWLLGLVG